MKKLTLVIVALIGSALLLNHNSEARSFPGANGKLLFQGYTGTWHQIYTANADGTNPIAITGLGNSYLDPQWSPDGTRITASKNGNIVVMDQDGSNEVTLSATGNNSNPSFSPDGDEIIFSTTRNGNADIYTVDSIDGTVLTQITSDPAEEIEPSFSPNGLFIAYVSNFSGSYDIHVNTPAGDSELILGTLQTNPENPVWSPDSTKIAYSASDTGNQYVYIMDWSGANQTQLSPLAQLGRGPSFSPQGNKILYFGWDGDSVAVYSMDTDGNNNAKISDAVTADKFAPSLQPIPIVIGINNPLPMAVQGNSISPISPTTLQGTANDFEVLGSLPDGISLDTNTGVLSGTPTAGNTYVFGIKANGLYGDESTSDLYWVILDPIILSDVQSIFQTGTSYSLDLKNPLSVVPENSLIFSVTEGALPAGLNLNSSTGQITGTPLVPGEYSFSVSAIAYQEATDTKAFTFTVNGANISGQSGESDTNPEALSETGEKQSLYTFFAALSILSSIVVQKRPAKQKSSF